MPGSEVRSALVAKQRVLTEHESETSFTSWQQSIMFNFVVDSKFSRYTDSTDLGTWEKSTVEHRGFTDDITDGEGVLSADIRMTKVQKCQVLTVLLGSIATFAPVISNKFITEQACSLADIFTRLRSHYGFRATGGRILELSQFALLPGESHNALWERMSAFLEDNLLRSSGGLTHSGEKVTTDEPLSATLQNVSVVLWLKTIHTDLPLMVKQKFATDLKRCTLFSIREDISDALPSILAEMQDRDYAVNFAKSFQKKPFQKFEKQGRKFSGPKKKICCLCQSSGREGFDDHYLSECRFLPLADKKYFSRIREVEEESDAEESDACSVQISPKVSNPVLQQGIVKDSNQVVRIESLHTGNANRVAVYPSPVLEMYVRNNTAEVTIDSGAEINLIQANECKRLNIDINPSVQRCRGAECSPLEVVGEVNFQCVRGHHTLQFSGLAVKTLNCAILAGMPFQVDNDVFTRPAAGQIMIQDCCRFKHKAGVATGGIRLCTASVLKMPRKMCVYPGEKVSVPVPVDFADKKIAIEPRAVSTESSTPPWIECQAIDCNSEGEITLCNNTDLPVIIKKNEQFAQIRHLEVDSDINVVQPSTVPNVKTPVKSISGPFSKLIEVDPEGLVSYEDRQEFHNINLEYDEVFSPTIGRYNGKSGPFQHVINMGPDLPPQQRGRNPKYSRSNSELLQAKIDELLDKGVLARPEDVGVNVEYVSPSFLVKKSNGGHRLVTAFHDLSEHCRPTPAAMPTVGDVVGQVSQWNFLIGSDVTDAYYHIDLSQESKKYCGIVSPFRGTLVYQRAVMGLPGSESSLENLLCKILGDLMLEGHVVKLADDLYVGAATVKELLVVWRKVLALFALNNIRLKPTKTRILPASTVLLGWLWKQGIGGKNSTLEATPHVLNTLKQCEPPATVSKLRSFIGSYKALAKVLPRHSDHLHVFDKLCASNIPATDRVEWTDELLKLFQLAKDHLDSAKTLTLPKENDSLQIVTDASGVGLAATLFTIRNGKAHLSGLFNAKRKAHQLGWLPCEIEALAITTAVKHFSPYINRSTQKTTVLTDSMPCVKAFQKFQRGEFSASPRVATYISTLSQYPGISLVHLPGKDNKISDFASRHPLECTGECQLCQFISRQEDSVVQSITVEDVLEGRKSVPYASRPAWLRLQQGCRDLRRVAELLRSGTDVSRATGVTRRVKQYLSPKCKIRLSSTYPVGLLVVDDVRPLRPRSQLIVVPREYVAGLLTSLHLVFNHATKPQLFKLFKRSYFALNSWDDVKKVVDRCHQCTSLQKCKVKFTQQSTSDAPESIGIKFSADIIKKDSQKTLILREYVSSYTDAVFVPKEDASSLSEGLVKLLSRMCPPTGHLIAIRTDPGTGFQALRNDPLIKHLNVVIEIGDEKNRNKNAISDRAISEFHEEVAKQQPTGGPISDITLALVIGVMNSRIRGSGHTSLEMWTKRDMGTGSEVLIDDKELIQFKQEERKMNHMSSAKYHSRGKTSVDIPDIYVGDLVYILQDREKGRCRERYLVAQIEDSHALLQKFTNCQLRSKQYKVHLSDLIVISQINSHSTQSQTDDDTSDEEEITFTLHDDVPEIQSSQDVEEDNDNECSVCNEEVTHEDQALLCDECGKWCHRACDGLDEEDYLELSSDFQYICPVHKEVLSDEQEDSVVSNEGRSEDSDVSFSDLEEPLVQERRTRPVRDRQPPDRLGMHKS